jgi:hypothetical protein
MLQKSVVVMFTLLLAAGAVAAQANDQTYDAAADFSLDSNPNGVWSYGYSLTLTGDFTPYTRSSTLTFGNPNFSSWRGDLSPFGDGTPLAVQNTADTTQQGAGANLDPGQLALHPGEEGEVSIVRWTAPDAGTIYLDATFTGRDNVHGTTTDVHVLFNGTSIFDGSINGFLDTTSYTDTFSVLAGDVIDFAVGVGDDKSFLSDTTGLDATITFCPDPA